MPKGSFSLDPLPWRTSPTMARRCARAAGGVVALAQTSHDAQYLECSCCTEIMRPDHTPQCRTVPHAPRTHLLLPASSTKSRVTTPGRATLLHVTYSTRYDTYATILRRRAPGNVKEPLLRWRVGATRSGWNLRICRKKILSDPLVGGPRGREWRERAAVPARERDPGAGPPRRSARWLTDPRF